jgi:hypothetical protein
MPSRGSWNGAWSGEGQNCTICKSLREIRVKELVAQGSSWTYNFGDGWFARVDMRVPVPGERRKKSDGFSGYDWMVESILLHGRIKT